MSVLREHGGLLEDFPEYPTRPKRKVTVITPDPDRNALAVRWRLAAFVALVAAAAFAAVLLDLPSASELRQVIEDAGWAAPMAFVALYALLSLAPVPKNAVSAVAGLLFGLVAGVLLVLGGALLGALLAFGLGRTLARGAVERLASSRVEQVDALLARRGLLAVIMVRLVPVVPFTAVNYTAGLTGVRFRDYTLGTALGMVPGTLAYVTLGAYGATPGVWPFLLSVAALVLLTVGGLLVARRRRPARKAAS